MIRPWLVRSSLLLGSVALVLSFSRSALASFLGIIIWYFVLRKKRTLKNIILSMLTTGVALFLMRQTVSWESESVVIRQQLNAAAITLWRESPLFGIGLGNFLVRLPDVLTSRTITFLQPVHNIYLLFMAEAGIAGVALCAYFVLRTVMQRKRKRIRVGHLPPPVLAYRLSLLVILILGLIDHYPLTLQQGQLLLTILLAVTIAPLF